MVLNRLALFDFRQIRYSFPRKPGLILRCARLMLGLSRKDVVRAAKGAGLAMTGPRYQVIENDLEGHLTGAGEWWSLCELLCLSCDMISYGYCARTHIMRVRGEIERGEFCFPVAPSLQARISRFVSWEDAQREQWMGRPGLRFQLRSNGLLRQLGHQEKPFQKLDDE